MQLLLAFASKIEERPSVSSLGVPTLNDLEEEALGDISYGGHGLDSMARAT